jgi:hypothetical protein
MKGQSSLSLPQKKGQSSLSLRSLGTATCCHAPGFRSNRGSNYRFRHTAEPRPVLPCACGRPDDKACGRPDDKADGGLQQRQKVPHPHI